MVGILLPTSMCSMRHVSLFSKLLNFGCKQLEPEHHAMHLGRALK